MEIGKIEFDFTLNSSGDSTEDGRVTLLECVLDRDRWLPNAQKWNLMAAFAQETGSPTRIAVKSGATPFKRSNNAM